MLFTPHERELLEEEPYLQTNHMRIPSLSSEEQKIVDDLKMFLTNRLGDSLVTFVLYGSKARGDYEERSDIDLAVIVRGLTREGKNEILEKVADLEMEHLIPLSTLVLSEEDFKNLKARERRIALDIEKDGIPL